MKTKDLSIEFCGVKCENPFFLSSSPVGACYDMCAKAFEAGWGGVVYKTIGFYMPNEVSPRFDHLRKETTPFVGFKNMEQISTYPLEVNLESIRNLKKNYPSKIVIASIMGENEQEWTDLARLVTEAGADIIECNFSCPQMTSHEMGSDVGQNPALVKKYCEAVRRGTQLPVLAKMTPNIGDMSKPALASIEGGADGLATINTIKSITGIDFDSMTAYPVINGKSSVSGYSGKAVKPIALRFIHELATNPKLKNIPISGIGGIETWEDCVEFILLGSSNLQVTTSVMQYGYRIVEDMIEGLSYFMEEKGIERLEDMVGLASKNIIPAEELDRSYIIYPEFDKEACIGCGRCYISCYDGGHQALSWQAEDRVPVLNQEKCVGCHLCAHVCPISCISRGTILNKKNITERSSIY